MKIAFQMDPIEPIDIQTAALEAILGFRDTERVADMLIERWGMLSPDIRHQAMDGMLSNRRWTTRILNAMADGKLRLNDVDTSQVQWLRRHPDPELRALAEGLSSIESDRSKVVHAYRPSLSNAGNFDRGLKVFEKHCASCHQIGKLGFAVGPSLAAMKNRGAESILVNVLDPNREINPDFLSYIVETVDGQQIAGIVVSETATTITMKLDQGKEIIVLRSDIETFESTGQSLMPEGLEKEITPDQMTDLLTFLLGPETNEAPK